jgi:Family of unknown function (DUF5719)
MSSSKMRVFRLVTALSAASAMAAIAFIPTWTFVDPSVKARKTTVSTVTLVCEVAPHARAAELTVVAQGAGKNAIQIAGFPRPSLWKVSGEQRFSLKVSPRTQFVSLHVDQSAVNTAQAVMTTRDVSRLNRGVASQSCAPTTTQWWFAGAAGTLGRDDVLVLSNPERTATVVNVEFITDHGIMTPAAAQGVVVPATGQRSIRINNLVPGRSAVAVHVTTTGGRIHAGVFVRASYGRFPVGSEWLTATSTDGTIVPFVGDTPKLSMVFAAPEGAASVKILALGRSGQFAPAGLPAFAVAAGHARVVKIPDVSVNASALLISSTAPVVAGYAGGVSIQRPQSVQDVAAASAVVPSKSDQTLAIGTYPRGRVAVIAAGPNAGASGVLIVATNGTVQRVPYSVPPGGSERIQLTRSASNVYIHASPDNGSGAYVLFVATRGVTGNARDAAGVTASVRSSSVVLRAVVQVP